MRKTGNYLLHLIAFLMVPCLLQTATFAAKKNKDAAPAPPISSYFQKCPKSLVLAAVIMGSVVSWGAYARWFSPSTPSNVAVNLSELTPAEKILLNRIQKLRDQFSAVQNTKKQPEFARWNSDPRKLVSPFSDRIIDPQDLTSLSKLTFEERVAELRKRGIEVLFINTAKGTANDKVASRLNGPFPERDLLVIELGWRNLSDLFGPGQAGALYTAANEPIKVGTVTLEVRPFEKKPLIIFDLSHPIDPRFVLEHEYLHDRFASGEVNRPFAEQRRESSLLYAAAHKRLKALESHLKRLGDSASDEEILETFRQFHLANIDTQYYGLKTELTGLTEEWDTLYSQIELGGAMGSTDPQMFECYRYFSSTLTRLSQKLKRIDSERNLGVALDNPSLVGEAGLKKLVELFEFRNQVAVAFLKAEAYRQGPHLQRFRALED